MHKEWSWVLELAQHTDMLARRLFARTATMIITHTLARLTVTTARIGF
jgi:poly-gamma-glutamate capsule biosynthesis protein CapA/YwtB (metallophosphatase superfamily)